MKPPFFAKVDVPLLAGRYGVSVADTLSEAIKAATPFLRKEVDPIGECKAGALQHRGRFVVVCSRRMLKHGILAHEIYHCTSNILGHSAVQTTYENDEAGAYLCDWLMEWTYKQLAKAGEVVKP